MNKKGFTLTELLVVIAIIAILSVVVIPSIISVNKNINERLYNQKLEYIESSAALYGSNNDEIFNGTDEVEVKVYELIATNYLNADIKLGEGNCNETTVKDSESTIMVSGCLINPNDKTSMNKMIVILKKENIGIVAKVVENNPDDTPVNTNDDLVSRVCAGFNNGSFIGKYDENDGSLCECSGSGDNLKLVKKGTTEEVDMCLIAGENVVNNYLKYGSDQANWRVLGLYKVGNDIVAKMITNKPI